jgi:hypothetical protein
MFSRSPKIERGTIFKAYQDEYFSHLLSSYLERDPKAIGETDDRLGRE